jgi:hypothetical protein
MSVRQFRYEVTSLDGGQCRKVIRATARPPVGKDTILKKNQAQEGRYVSREKGTVGAATALRNWLFVKETITSPEVVVQAPKERVVREEPKPQGSCMVVVEPKIWRHAQ